MRSLGVGVVTLLVSLVVSGANLAYGAGNEPMTKAEFAAILARTMGMEMPKNADQLSDAELFEVQANMLKEAGISLFGEAEAEQFVTVGDFANALYDALMGPNPASLADKIAYLTGKGYLVVDPATGPNSYMRSADIIEALNIPELSKAVAEAYSRIGMIGGGIVAPLGGTIPPAPYNVEAESPATPIKP